jgi:hypothetical protein
MEFYKYVILFFRLIFLKSDANMRASARGMRYDSTQT